MRAALYARVSTSEQHPENQLIDLRRYARDRGFDVVEEYVDRGISGTKDTRPALDRMMDMARKRKLDAILVWRFDRFARSVRHLVMALEELDGLGVRFVSYQESIDTQSAIGRAMFSPPGPAAKPTSRLHRVGRIPRSAGPENSLTNRILVVSGADGQPRPSSTNGWDGCGAAQLAAARAPTARTSVMDCMTRMAARTPSSVH